MDSAAVSLDSWLKLGASAVCVALVAVLILDAYRVRIPKLQQVMQEMQERSSIQSKLFGEMLENQRKDLVSEIKTQRQEFTAEMREQRLADEKRYETIRADAHGYRDSMHELVMKIELLALAHEGVSVKDTKHVEQRT